MCVEIDRTKGLKRERIAWCVVRKTADPKKVERAYYSSGSYADTFYQLGREYTAKRLAPGNDAPGFHVFLSRQKCKEFLSDAYKEWADLQPRRRNGVVCQCRVRGPIGAGVIPEGIEGEGMRVMKYKYRTLLEVVE